MTNDIARPPADTQTGGMTIRVYTVNHHGTVVRDRGTVNVLPGSEPPPFRSDFPPCRCPGCRQTRAVDANPVDADPVDADPVNMGPVRATAAGSGAACPPDIAAMRATAALLLGADGNGTEGPPPVPEDLDVLTAALRGHLELLIPAVRNQAGRLPDDSVPRYCALACIGEAYRRLDAGPSHRYGGDVGHARRLARVLRALCGHYETASRQTP
ncbi:DUF6415 family natural product biosynthesis protein [Streptomyces sp. NPDC006012]|uniref:DUF6415 family natural product biosynthesis protein n=1 Tax=Streptomyces sp. NPDC006012 TaxID=3364739 RepID=UPI0036C6AD2B